MLLAHFFLNKSHIWFFFSDRQLDGLHSGHSASPYLFLNLYHDQESEKCPRNRLKWWHVSSEAGGHRGVVPYCKPTLWHIHILSFQTFRMFANVSGAIKSVAWVTWLLNIFRFMASVCNNMLNPGGLIIVTWFAFCRILHYHESWSFEHWQSAKIELKDQICDL